VELYIHSPITPSWRGAQLKEAWGQLYWIEVIDCSASRPDRFTPGEKAPGTHWTGAWVGYRVTLAAVAKRKKIVSPTGDPPSVVQPVTKSL